jgi:hypothetical protein
MNRAPKRLNRVAFLRIAALAAAAFVAIGLASEGRAQTEPQIFVTWRAESYAPPAYQGKILPTAGSIITASLEVISGGRPADLSKETIYWRVNDFLVENRPGVKTISFNAPEETPDILSLEIMLPFYKDSTLLKVIQIPLVRPEAVIEAPYPGKRFSGTRLKMAGLPYFFKTNNVNSLGFSWSINGGVIIGAESPREFIVNLNPDAPVGSTLNIGLTVNNPGFAGEAASASTVLTRAQ